MSTYKSIDNMRIEIGANRNLVPFPKKKEPIGKKEQNKPSLKVKSNSRGPIKRENKDIPRRKEFYQRKPPSGNLFGAIKKNQAKDIKRSVNSALNSSLSKDQIIANKKTNNQENEGSSFEENV